MNYKVIFTRKADKQMEDITVYIGRHNPLRAISFVAELRRAIQDLEHNPFIYQAFGKYRRLVFKKYIALYSVNEKTKIVTVRFVSEGHVNWNVNWKP